MMRAVGHQAPRQARLVHQSESEPWPPEARLDDSRPLSLILFTKFEYMCCGQSLRGQRRLLETLLADDSSQEGASQIDGRPLHRILRLWKTRLHHNVRSLYIRMLPPEVLLFGVRRLPVILHQDPMYSHLLPQTPDNQCPLQRPRFLHYMGIIT